MSLRTKNLFFKQKDIIVKDGPSDSTQIVTDVDEYNDKYLRNELGKLLPEAGIISEENDSLDSDKELVWTIDPIDGTYCYSRQIPTYGIIIGLWKDQVPQLSVISYPHFDEYLIMDQVKGIRINHSKMKRSNATLSDIFYAADTSRDLQDRIKLVEDINKLCGKSPKRIYSSSYITKLFAIGMCHGAILRNVAIWDIVGLLLAAEIKGTKYKIFPEDNWFKKDNIKKYNKTIVVGENFFNEKSLNIDV